MNKPTAQTNAGQVTISPLTIIRTTFGIIMIQIVSQGYGFRRWSPRGWHVAGTAAVLTSRLASFLARAAAVGGQLAPSTSSSFRLRPSYHRHFGSPGYRL